MQVNECKRIKKSYQKPQNSLLESPCFSFRPLYIIHQKMHRIIPVWEQNPIQLGFTFLFSHTIASFSFPIPSPRTSQNKCISHSPVAKDYPDFKPTFQRIGILLLHLHLGMTEVSFPERSPHGTGLTPGWLQKVLSKTQKQQESP